MPRQTTHSNIQAPQKNKPRDPVPSGERDAAVNRAASHNYFLLDRFEAGVALRGTEVKSIREGKANLKDAYGLIKDGEASCSTPTSGPIRTETPAITTHSGPENSSCISKKSASYCHRRRSKGIRSSPPGSTSAEARSSANWPSPKASRTGTNAKPSAAAKPIAKPAPPSSATKPNTPDRVSP